MLAMINKILFVATWSKPWKKIRWTLPETCFSGRGGIGMRQYLAERRSCNQSKCLYLRDTWKSDMRKTIKWNNLDSTKRRCDCIGNETFETFHFGFLFRLVYHTSIILLDWTPLYHITGCLKCYLYYNIKAYSLCLLKTHNKKLPDKKSQFCYDQKNRLYE